MEPATDAEDVRAPVMRDARRTGRCLRLSQESGGGGRVIEGVERRAGRVPDRRSGRFRASRIEHGDVDRRDGEERGGLAFRKGVPVTEPIVLGSTGDRREDERDTGCCNERRQSRVCGRTQWPTPWAWCAW